MKWLRPPSLRGVILTIAVTLIALLWWRSRTHRDVIFFFVGSQGRAQFLVSSHALAPIGAPSLSSFYQLPGWGSRS